MEIALPADDSFVTWAARVELSAGGPARPARRLRLLHGGQNCKRLLENVSRLVFSDAANGNSEIKNGRPVNPMRGGIVRQSRRGGWRRYGASPAAGLPLLQGPGQRLEYC